MGLRTIHLKLHNPSTLKRNIIASAFLNYNNAFNYLLQKAFENIDTIESEYKSPKGTYSNLTISKWIDKELLAKINQFDIQPFKDSLKLDFGITLASYFVQKKLNPAIVFPNFKTEAVTSQDKLRPIYFCRYDTKRSFCFLYDAQNDKFFAKLFLMNSKNAKPRTGLKFSRELNYISKNKKEVKSLKKETFIIVPLSFGKWQENMLKQAIIQPEILRTAHLIRKGNDYFLSLSIDLPEDAKVAPTTYLGVSRGIEKAINYAIVDMGGNMMESGTVESESTPASTDIKADICILANKLVDIAVKNKSIVILQNLVGKGDKLSWVEGNITYKPIFGCKCYNDLVRVLEYKLPQKGLPVPAKVSSVDIFHRCRLCGSNTKKNRFSKTMFICTACGLSYNLDSLGSINLATRLIKYNNTPIKFKAKKTNNGIYFQNELIGLDLFIAKNQNPIDTLKEEIMKIYSKVNQEAHIYKQNTKDINSIIDKLIKQDFKNIEII
ncbi:MAG: transposase [Ruminiclostridium sp.]